MGSSKERTEGGQHGGGGSPFWGTRLLFLFFLILLVLLVLLVLLFLRFLILPNLVLGCLRPRRLALSTAFYRWTLGRCCFGGRCCLLGRCCFGGRCCLLGRCCLRANGWSRHGSFGLPPDSVACLRRCRRQLVLRHIPPFSVRSASMTANQ